MPEDIELSVKLVPDESAIEDLESREFGVGGGGDSDEQIELSESQDSRLQVANRKLGRIAKSVGKLGIIAAALALVAKILGDVFDIGFEDVRRAIVTAIDQLGDAIESFLPGGGMTQAPTSSEAASGILAGLPALFAGGGAAGIGAGLAELVTQRGVNLNSNTDTSAGSDQTVNLMTSRMSIIGDSTQQEMQSNQVESNTIVGGS